MHHHALKHVPEAADRIGQTVRLASYRALPYPSSSPNKQASEKGSPQRELQHSLPSTPHTPHTKMVQIDPKVDLSDPKTKVGVLQVLRSAQLLHLTALW